jgi:hypothetical protein
MTTWPCCSAGWTPSVASTRPATAWITVATPPFGSLELFDKVMA